MDILATQPNAANSVAAAATAPSSGTTLTSDFETFLQMLTAQAKYQDPLEPLDSTEYASQLAQFSGVEQQVKSNELLTSLVNQMSGSNMAQFAGWIGMEARTTAPTYFDGSPISIVPTSAAAADEVNMIVTNANGDEVQRLPLGKIGPEPVEWAGVRSNGAPYPTGSYTFTFESVNGGDVIATHAGETYARVTEARDVNGAISLILEGGNAVSSADVKALREAS